MILESFVRWSVAIMIVAFLGSCTVRCVRENLGEPAQVGGCK